MINKFVKITKTGNGIDVIPSSEAFLNSRETAHIILEVTLSQAQTTASTVRNLVVFDSGIKIISLASVLFTNNLNKIKDIKDLQVWKEGADRGHTLWFKGVANEANDKLTIGLLTEPA